MCPWLCEAFKATGWSFHPHHSTEAKSLSFCSWATWGSEKSSSLPRVAGLVWGGVGIRIKVSWFQVHYVAAVGFLVTVFRFQIQTRQNFFFKQMIFSSKASDSTTKILTTSKRCCSETDNYGFHLFPGSWRRKLMKPMNHLQGAVCNHYLETDGQLCKNPLQLISFF